MFLVGSIGRWVVVVVMMVVMEECCCCCCWKFDEMFVMRCYSRVAQVDVDGSLECWRDVDRYFLVHWHYLERCWTRGGDGIRIAHDLRNVVPVEVVAEEVVVEVVDYCHLKYHSEKCCCNDW